MADASAQLLKEFPQLGLEAIQKIIKYCNENKVEVPADFVPEPNKVHHKEPTKVEIEGRVEYFENPEDAPPVQPGQEVRQIIN